MIIQKGFHKYKRIDNDKETIDGCTKCCFRYTKSNGEIECDAPCSCLFWSCAGGKSYFTKIR